MVIYGSDGLWGHSITVWMTIQTEFHNGGHNKSLRESSLREPSLYLPKQLTTLEDDKKHYCLIPKWLLETKHPFARPEFELVFFFFQLFGQGGHSQAGGLLASRTGMFTGLFNFVLNFLKHQNPQKYHLFEWWLSIKAAVDCYKCSTFSSRELLKLGVFMATILCSNC